MKTKVLKKLIDESKKVYASGLVMQDFGNVSMRVGEEIYIKASGTPMAKITKKDCETIKLIPQVATTESKGLPYKYLIISFSNIRPKMIVITTPNAIAIGNGKLKTFPDTTVP